MKLDGKGAVRERGQRHFALRIALGYGIAGALWILFSDEIMTAFVSAPEAIRWVSITKGWGFVLITALALYALIGRWQRRAEGRDKALRDSEARYRSLVELSPDAILIHSKGVIRYANPAAARIWRATSPEALVGMPVLDLVHPDFRQRVTDRIRQLGIGADRVPVLLEKFLCLDGTVIEGEAAASAMALDGEPAVQVVMRDVTERHREAERLRWLSRVVEQVGEGVCVFGQDQKVIFANRAWAEMHGFGDEDLTGLGHAAFHSAEQLRDGPPHLENPLGPEGKFTGEVWHVRRDGTPFPAEMTVSLLTDESGEAVGRIAFAREISERLEARRLLEESEAKFRVLAEHGLSSIMVFRGRDLVYANPATQDISGRSLEELLGLGYWEMVHPDFRQEVWGQASALLRGETATFRLEFKILTKEGAERWVDCSAGPVALKGRPAALATAFDITDRKRSEARLEHLAHFDFLTGLPNRLLFNERLGNTLAEAAVSKSCAGLLFLDLDRFKDVNDMLGHDVGDLILQGVSRRLATGAPEGATVARTSSDEFAILLPGLAPDAAPQIAEREARRAVAQFERPFVVAGQEVHVRSSVGVCLYPADGDDVETLMKNADIALLRARAQGGDSYQFVTTDLSAKAAEQITLKNRLRKAIERQEFRLHYQPILDQATGRVVALEALVRWEHPELGLLMPGRFVGLAEETGLILPLGEWVLYAACAQNRAWQKAGLSPVRVGVNLSARQFQQRDLIETVSLVLASTGLEPRYLELEITESTAMADMDNTVAMLERLSGLGIALSIDDFGTGYSSLAYLKKFPIQNLKIDHSFVWGVPGNEDDSAIVRAVVTMAHSLDLRVVAEGVETLEQLTFLREIGCDAVQGYYFNRPAPPEAWTRESLDW